MTDDYNDVMEIVQARRKAVSCIIGFTCGCITLLLFGLWWSNQRRSQWAELRARDLPITIKKAELIIMAINRYKKDKKKCPSSLNDLVPRYIERLPDAGAIAKNGWHYRTDKDIAKQTSGVTVSVDEQAGGWVLFVWVRDEYSPNAFGFGDAFVFHPSGQYPQHGYGGMLVPFRNWGYYIE